MAKTWDADSTQMGKNTAKVSSQVVNDAQSGRVPISRELARQWHFTVMSEVVVPPPFNQDDIGRFRYEPGAEDRELEIGDGFGRKIHDLPLPAEVGPLLDTFEARLNIDLAELDKRYPGGTMPDARGISTIIEVAARAHNEWVRIHPFANGNGRTARSWANFVFARYTLRPPFRVRPRPEGGYEEAASEGMLFNDVPMRDFIGEQFVRQATQSIFKS
jgi:Fic/DOC family